MKGVRARLSSYTTTNGTVPHEEVPSGAPRRCNERSSSQSLVVVLVLEPQQEEDDDDEALKSSYDDLIYHCRVSQWVP